MHGVVTTPCILFHHDKIVFSHLRSGNEFDISHSVSQADPVRMVFCYSQVKPLRDVALKTACLALAGQKS